MHRTRKQPKPVSQPGPAAQAQAGKVIGYSAIPRPRPVRLVLDGVESWHTSRDAAVTAALGVGDGHEYEVTLANGKTWGGSTTRVVVRPPVLTTSWYAPIGVVKARSRKGGIRLMRRPVPSIVPQPLLDVTTYIKAKPFMWITLASEYDKREARRDAKVAAIAATNMDTRQRRAVDPDAAHTLVSQADRSTEYLVDCIVRALFPVRD